MDSASLQPSHCNTAVSMQYQHDFGQGEKKTAEQRAILVTVLTLLTMAVEIVAGIVTGSMALLADGIHMAGHAMALGLTAGAYYLTRRHAHNRRLSLGSGKIGDLAAYTSGLLLAAATLWLIVESVHRLLIVQTLEPLEAMLVATIGLLVNLASAWLLAGGHHHHHGHDHHGHHHHHDANLRAALVHVLADAMTSVAAIVGLLAAWLWGWDWLDPVIALVACVVIMRWAYGLLKQTVRTLLDHEAPKHIREQVETILTRTPDTHIVDLHIWSVGQNTWTMTAALVTHADLTPEKLRSELHNIPGLHHPIVEINFCSGCHNE